MTLFTTEKELTYELYESLNRVKKEANLSGDFASNSIQPVTVPLNSDGETLVISCNNVSKFYTGDSSLRISYVIPRKLIDMENEHPNSYAKEVYDSKALDMVNSVIGEILDFEENNFLFSEATPSTFVFKTTVSIHDPTIAPTDKDYEITPVLTVNVEKKYIYKNKNKSTMHCIDNNVDILLKPNLNEKNVEFDKEVNIFGQDLIVKHRNKENLGSVITLENDDEVYGYVSNLGGAWNHLINAKGEYPEGDLF